MGAANQKWAWFAHRHLAPPKYFLEDLFAMLDKGDIFTKLDLSQAYQQLALDRISRKKCSYQYSQRFISLYYVSALRCIISSRYISKSNGDATSRNSWGRSLH